MRTDTAQTGRRQVPKRPCPARTAGALLCTALSRILTANIYYRNYLSKETRPMKILLIRDTHRRDNLFLRVMEQEATVDMIIHAGDA